MCRQRLRGPPDLPPRTGGYTQSVPACTGIQVPVYGYVKRGPPLLTNFSERSDARARRRGGAAAPTRPNLLAARTARTFRPPFPLSLSPPPAVCGAAAHAVRAALRQRNAAAAASSGPGACKGKREVRPFAAASPPACILPCVAARFATQDASVRATMQAGMRSMHNARGETGGAEPSADPE